MNTLLKYSSRSFSFTYPCPRKLREIVKLSIFEKEEPSVIKDLWTDYHNAKPHTISKVISQPLYMQLLQKYKTFSIHNR